MSTDRSTTAGSKEVSVELEDLTIGDVETDGVAGGRVAATPPPPPGPVPMPYPNQG
jgi:hypothetical protein